MQVIFTPLAERQLEKLHEYISDISNEERADGYVTRIVDYCKGFVTFPLRGPRDGRCQEAASDSCADGGRRT